MNPLRVGIITAAPHSAEPWERQLLKRISEDDRLQLAAVIVAETAPASEAGGAYGLIRRLDRKVFGRAPAAPGYDDFGRDVPHIAFADALSDPAALALDLVIEAVDASGAEALRDAVPYGGWTFDFCLIDAVKADVTGFWEAFGRAELTPVSVIRRRDGEARLAARTAFNTKFSGARNAAYLKVRAVSLMVKELRRLSAERSLDAAAPVYAAGPARRPGAGAAIGYGVGVMRELARRAAMEAWARLGLRSDMWAIHVGRGGAPFVSIDDTRKIDPFLGELWADPFLWRRDDGLYVFFENFSYRTRLGRISVGRLEDDGLRFLGDALDLEHHLSYPFIFSHGDQIYMMPERHQADRVEVWRCVDFPLKWELHATALEGRSPADSLLHFDGEGWWLFTNLADKLYPDHCAELHVFKVDGPDLKSVTAHEANPVVIGSELARNGGRIFARGGRLFRPAQINTHGVYGYGLNIMEISDLSLDRYTERLVHRITPEGSPDLRGCHHMDVDGEVFVIDVCHRLGGRGRPAAPVVRF
ncbi:MAG: hypothetical protein ACK4YQ_12750 [Phenylobacterium sp.]|uniref:glucosamine inositolphosphorylceramide transferase family protein n=1 Tax=Phenylobacterium sp. TaxID=1871053 RepID=UPI00391913C8